MGVIRKKTAARPGEGGVKYVCDVCSADITNTVRVRCDNEACPDYDLCVLCFSQGKSSNMHKPATHSYRVIEQNAVPIYDPEWGADEELLLLEGCEIYGLGSWADIADHIGGYRDKDEVRDHYVKYYIESPDFPLPKRSLTEAFDYSDESLRTNFQKAKKQRIEERKEKAKNQPPAIPKAKPTASVPSCHEIQGYMPGRLEFETEFANEAEEAVQHMQFDPGDGINPRTGEMEPEMDLKMTVMDIYNSRLTQRVDRKKVIFEHNLLDYRKNAAADKKRTKEERDLVNKAKPFARMMNREDFKEFNEDLVEELNLRQAIRQLREWRLMRVTDLRSGEKYEAEKQQRIQTQQPMGSLDRERFATARSKAAQPIEVPSGAAALIAPDLPIRLQSNTANGTPKDSPHLNGLNGIKSESHTNGTSTPTPKPRAIIQPLPGVQPLNLNQENAPGLQLLTKEEIELCRTLRLQPKPYLAIKEAIVKEAVRVNGMLKKKQVREICHLDSQKGGRIFEFFVASGWVGEADERTLAMQRARWARATSGVGVKAEKDDREGRSLVNTPLSSAESDGELWEEPPSSESGDLRGGAESETEKAASEKSESEKAVIKKPVTEKPMKRKWASEKSSSEASRTVNEYQVSVTGLVSAYPASEKAVSEKPVMERPLSRKWASEKPVMKWPMRMSREWASQKAGSESSATVRSAGEKSSSEDSATVSEYQASVTESSSA